MHQAARDLIEQGDKLFSKRMPLMSRWQEIADAMYPLRAHFTRQSDIGEDFASGHITSYPMIVHRELGNTFSSMLRPSDKEWAQIGIGEDEIDHGSRVWLEAATKTLRSAMYDPRAKFVRATKEADLDYAAFGNAVITVEPNVKTKTLLYRNWHLRDVVWCEGTDGAVETVHRKWTPTARELFRIFGDGCHEKVRQLADKEPYKEIHCRHVVIPTEHYDGTKFATDLVSLYIDVDNKHVMEERGARHNPYVIPRWQTVSGSQYGYSPAAIIALPDVRTLQAMTLTLLEAGERAALPPIVATKQAIRGELDLRSGGVTWIDDEYDERKGDALRAIDMGSATLPFGLDMLQDQREQLRKAFFLDKLEMPMRGPEMTAYEVGQRVQQYIRDALPLFEPVETDYNAALCERTFEILMDFGTFGHPGMIPDGLQGRDVKFRFESPLREAIEKQKTELFMQAANIIATAAQSDPSLARLVNAERATRDVLAGLGAPTKWFESEEDMAAIREQLAQQAQAQQQLAMAQQASEVAKNVGVTA